MTEENQDFTMWQGETKTLEVQEVDETDITDQVITWVLADEPGDSPEITKDNDGNGGVSITDAATGKYEISLDPADTENLAGRYYHESRVDDEGGTESVLFTGEVVIKESPTS